MDRIRIAKKTVEVAAESLGEPSRSPNEVEEVEVFADDGTPAMVEFMSIFALRNNVWCWQWEATTCWPA